MESSTLFCKSCKTLKASIDFMGFDAKETPKKFRSCRNCRQKFRESNEKRKRKEFAETDDDNQIEIIDMDFLSEIVHENMLLSSSESHLHYKININSYVDLSLTFPNEDFENTDDSLFKDLANEIVELIEDVDKYNWTYHHQHINKESISYWYFCSQRDILAKKPRKHIELSKQRDVSSMERYKCDGFIKVSIDKTMEIAEVTLIHKILHQKPVDTYVSQEVKDFIKDNIDLLPREIYARLINKGIDLSIRQKQIHFWWTKLGQIRYRRHDNAFESAYTWLLENQYKIVLYKTEPVNVLAFDTGILDQLNKFGIIVNECGIDATYNTNNMGFELYVLHAEVNGTGFPLSYLFLENNGKCKDGVRTGMLQMFLAAYYNQGIQPRFFLTDKDYAQINAIQFTWPHCKIQLCKWHVNRAITMRLSSNKNVRSSGFNPLSEIGKKFPFDGIQQATQFCPKDLRKSLWQIMEKHLHYHPFIPTRDGQF